MTVENLEINVKTNVSGSSAQTIKSLADALGQLQAKAAALTGFSNLSSLATAMQSISGTSIKSSAFSGMAKGIENLSAALSTLSSEDVARLSELSVSLKSLNGVDLSGLGNASNVARAAKGLKQTEQGIRNVGAAANESKKHTSAFGSSLMRIFKYRMIRTVIKEIGQAFSEGLKNAYLFSAGLATISGRRFADAMDTMNSKATQMKAQIGSAFISLLTAIEPVVTRIIELAIRAADAVSQLIAAFTGKTYLRAAAVTDSLVDDFQSGAKAAKEWKNQLLGFDVINRLNEPSSGGGGLTPEELFGGEEAPIEDKFLKLADKLKGIIDSLKITISDVLFDWDDLTGEQIAEKVISGLGALVGAAVGFLLGGVPGAVTGSIIGASLGIVFSSLIFDHDGVLSENEVLRMVCAVAGALAGGVIGFVVGGPGGAAIGAMIGAGLGLYAHKLIFSPDGQDRTKALSTLITTLFAIAGGLIGFAIGGKFGAVIGATVGAGVGLLVSKALFQKGNANQKALMSTIVGVLGLIAGGLIGFKLGGPLGAVIGATIGAGVGLLVVNSAFYKGTQKDAKSLATTLVAVLSALVGGVIGFALGGIPGAILAVAITSGLSLAVTNAMFADSGMSLKQVILNSLVVVLGALVGGAIGFVVGGPLGAAIGVAIGAGITLYAENVAWDAKSKAKIQSESENVFSDYVSGNFGNNNSTGNVFADYASGNLVKTDSITDPLVLLPKMPGLFATGGFPESGQLFLSREAGPELVGSIGGRTAVANNDQIVQAVSDGVFNAVTAAMSNENNTDRPINVRVYLDSREIKSGQQRLNRAMGV